VDAPSLFSDKEAALLEALVNEGVDVPVLPLSRIIASKRATGRPKDLAILPALEDALRIQRRRAAAPDGD